MEYLELKNTFVEDEEKEKDAARVMVDDSESHYDPSQVQVSESMQFLENMRMQDSEYEANIRTFGLPSLVSSLGDLDISYLQAYIMLKTIPPHLLQMPNPGQLPGQHPHPHPPLQSGQQPLSGLPTPSPSQMPLGFMPQPSSGQPPSLVHNQYSLPPQVRFQPPPASAASGFTGGRKPSVVTSATTTATWRSI